MVVEIFIGILALYSLGPVVLSLLPLVLCLKYLASKESNKFINFLVKLTVTIILTHFIVWLVVSFNHLRWVYVGGDILRLIGVFVYGLSFVVALFASGDAKLKSELRILGFVTLIFSLLYLIINFGGSV